jgi:hypothetical protein
MKMPGLGKHAGDLSTLEEYIGVEGLKAGWPNQYKPQRLNYVCRITKRSGTKGLKEISSTRCKHVQLYEVLNYHSFEQKLDQLFSKNKKV